MKITIGILVLIAIALAVYGKYVSDHDPNPDNVAGTFPLIGAMIFGIGAALLTAGWGLYRLFTS